MTEQHKLRTGDLVRFRSVGAIGKEALGDWVESMVVYADHATGLLAPACAGDAWEIGISACELVTPATDEQHARVLDRFANLISKGTRLEAGARALEIHRPANVKAATDEIERMLFVDLCQKAGGDAQRAAIAVATLADNSMGPWILMAAAQKLTILACAAFATALKPGAPAAKVSLTDDDRTLAVWRAVMTAWALAPDSEAAAKKLGEGLGALAPAEFIMSAATVPMGGGQ